MIPILYESTETSFTSAGITRLTDCIRCLVTEERNGVYEVEFDYPVSGKRFSDITIGRIIACTHDEGGDIQPFDIYKKTEPINGVVTFYGQHISYRLNELVVKPFTASSCYDAMIGIKQNTLGTNPFSFYTDKDVSTPYELSVPKNAREILGGEENSILDVYGTGEYQFDGWDVNLLLHRGTDTNVSIRYGKNLIDYTAETDVSEAYTAVVPYWYGITEGSDDDLIMEEVLVTLPEWSISSGETLPSQREVVVPLDLSEYFEAQPTVSQLRSLAQSKLASSQAWESNQTVSVDFVQLWQTEEYKQFAPLQQLKLCDTCGIFVPMYDTALRAKVVTVVWDALLDRYDSMELGDKPTTYAAVIDKKNSAKLNGLAAQVGSLITVVGTVTDELGNIFQLFVETTYTDESVIYTAILLKNNEDVSASYANDLNWSAKLTSGFQWIATGRSITIPKTNLHYAQAVTVKWTRRHNAYLLDNAGNNLVISTGDKLIGRTEY